MAGELRQKQFIENEVKPVIKQTIPDILKRLDALEGKTYEVKVKGETLKDSLGGDEGLAAIKSSKTLVEAVGKVKKVKAKKG